jgi:hypothetical protein
MTFERSKASKTNLSKLVPEKARLPEYLGAGEQIRTADVLLGKQAF